MLRGAANLLLSSHPEPVAAVTTISGVLALLAGKGVTGTAIVVLAVLSGQFFVGWTNDYLDRQRDAAAERRDKPVARGDISPRVVRAAALAALAACVILSLAAGVVAGISHLLAVALATAYNLDLKSTPLSLAPYALAFPLLATFITLARPDGHLPPLWALLAAALLGSAGHFTQVLPDIESDLRHGKRGLPQRLGARASAVAAAALLALAALDVALAPGARISIRSLLALLFCLLLALRVLLAARQNQLQLAFRLTILTAASVLLPLLASGRSL